MDKRRLWIVTAVLGFSGCGGEEVTPPPSGAPSSPAIKPTAPPAGPGVGSASQPGRPEPAKSEAAKGPAADEKAGTADAPPLEAPKTGAADSGGKVKLTDKQLANIHKLPAAEQAAAIQQAICPVSGEPLGSMGTPIKATAEGRTFYLCCDGCEDKVKSDPKGVVAKLDQK